MLKDVYIYGVIDFNITVVSILPITFNLEWAKPIHITADYFGALTLFDMFYFHGNGKIE